MIAKRSLLEIQSMTATAIRIIMISERDLSPFIDPDLLGQLQADAAGADDADDGRRARVGFEEIEHLPGDDREHLRQQAKAHGHAGVAAACQHGFPRRCFLSAASIASENSLPSAPESDTAIASTPANGPRPTTPTKTSAQIRASTPRMVSRQRRIAKAE